METRVCLESAVSLFFPWQHISNRWIKSTKIDGNCIPVAHGSCFTRLLRSLRQKWGAKTQALPKFWKANLQDCLPCLETYTIQASSLFSFLWVKAPQKAPMSSDFIISVFKCIKHIFSASTPPKHNYYIKFSLCAFIRINIFVFCYFHCIGTHCICSGVLQRHFGKEGHPTRLFGRIMTPQKCCFEE